MAAGTTRSADSDGTSGSGTDRRRRQTPGARRDESNYTLITAGHRWRNAHSQGWGREEETRQRWGSAGGVNECIDSERGGRHSRPPPTARASLRTNQRLILMAERVASAGGGKRQSGTAWWRYTRCANTKKQTKRNETKRKVDKAYGQLTAKSNSKKAVAGRLVAHRAHRRTNQGKNEDINKRGGLMRCETDARVGIRPNRRPKTAVSRKANEQANERSPSGEGGGGRETAEAEQNDKAILNNKRHTRGERQQSVVH